MRHGLRPLSIRTRLTAWYAGILLAILLVISALSYSLLRWNLVRDVDASLTTVARVMRDTGDAGAPAPSAAGAEAAIREILGPECSLPDELSPPRHDVAPQRPSTMPRHTTNGDSRSIGRDIGAAPVARRPSGPFLAPVSLCGAAEPRALSGGAA